MILVEVLGSPTLLFLLLVFFRGHVALDTEGVLVGLELLICSAFFNDAS